MFRREFVAALLGILLVLSARNAEAQALKFFKNYIVTGDYVVAGVPLRGTGGSGVIDMTNANVPEDADILAAFLYWQTILATQDSLDVGTLGATFRGHSLDVLKDGITYSIAKALNPSGTAPCWSSGGTTGDASGSHHSVSYRADVARFFDHDPVSGKTIVNAMHAVSLPDAGATPSQTPSTAGASLLVVYRNRSKPLNAIVIEDGGFTLNNQAPGGMVQAVSGYYQPAANPVARVTHIVADGQDNFTDQAYVNDIPVGPPNSFVGPAWENRTFEITPATLGTGGTSTVKVTGSDCLSWSALVFSTTVQDTDEDGLIDIVESSPTPLPDPAGGFLPNLHAMGADPNVQDMFVQVGYMSTSGYTNSVQTVPAHTHLPPRSVLEAVATTLHNAAPRRSRLGSPIPGPINIHFDVGSNYQSGLPTLAQCQANWQAACAIVPLSAGAIGGDEIPETVGCLTDSAGNTTCGGDFPNFPGTVGWKSGFNLLKNQPLGYVVSEGGPSIEEQCTADPNCQRRFSRNRRNLFRYALMAHALGLERVDASGNPILDQTGAKMPKNTSGIGDGGGVGGADLMMTLGLWDDFVGSNFMQRSTLLHEFGHTVALRHGGGPPVEVSPGHFVAQPNCKSNLLSIMNYLFQVRGLVGADGIPATDYSRQVLTPLNEGGLTEDLSQQLPWNAMAYRTAWYAPLANVSNVTGTVTRHCDGTLAAGGQTLVRVQGTSMTGKNDWNADGDTADTSVVQDLNFNGVLNDGTGDNLAQNGFNDFAQMDLRQVGGRRNAGSERIDGGLSLDVGFGDIGFGDIGFGDIGFGDIGFGDIGFGDIGVGDVGFGDIGFGDIGFGDIGFGDIGFGDIGAPRGDLDFETAADLNGPNALTATALQKAIRLNWTAPHLGNVQGYNVYRATGTAITQSSVLVRLGTTLPTTAATTFDDLDVKNNVTYTYFVVAQLTNGHLTGASNFVTIKK